jgi:hypothetical protein
VDSTANQASGISSIVNMVVDYKGHSEHIQLAMTQLGKQYAIPQLLLAPETQPRDQLGDQGSSNDMLPNQLLYLRRAVSHLKKQEALSRNSLAAVQGPCPVHLHGRLGRVT